MWSRAGPRSVRSPAVRGPPVDDPALGVDHVDGVARRGDAVGSGQVPARCERDDRAPRRGGGRQRADDGEAEDSRDGGKNWAHETLPMRLLGRANFLRETGRTGFAGRRSPRPRPVASGAGGVAPGMSVEFGSAGVGIIRRHEADRPAVSIRRRDHRRRATTGWSRPATCARAGKRVVVLERRDIVGGAVTTEELIPGYHFSACSFLCYAFQPQIVPTSR